MVLITTYHPTAAFFYNPWELGAFAVDVSKFARAIKGTLRPGPSMLVIDPKVETLHSLESEGLPIACDVETTWAPGDPASWKDFSRSLLKTISFGNRNWGLAFAWEDASEVLRNAARALVARNTIIYHNGNWADKRVLARFGFDVSGPYEDTIDWRRALVSTSKLGLGYCATLYDDPGPWKEDEESEDAKGMVHTTDIHKLLRYNAQDSVETARVWDGLIHEPEWNEPHIQRLYTQHKRTAEIAAKMNTRGFLVDRVEQEALRAELTKLAADRAAQFRALVGVDCSVSPNTIRALLYRRYAVVNLPCFEIAEPLDSSAWSEKGTIKVDQSNLLNLIVDPEVPDRVKEIIQAYWHAQAPVKALSTFVDSDLVRDATRPNGRLGAGWNPRGADTGRWSCADPNIQNLPEKKKDQDGALGGDLPNVRRLYRAEPGRVLVHADYSQLELRVRAAVMGDHVLAAHLAEGDVYSRNAIEWFGLPVGFDVKKLKPAARKASKIIHLGSQYAAGVAKIHVQALRVDRKHKFALTRALHAQFLKTYWRTRQWWEEEYEWVKQHGYSETRITGRRRYYPRVPEITETSNYGIQGTAADIANASLIELDKLGLSILTQLHDAYDVECEEREAEQVAQIMKEVMERPFEINGTKYVFPIELKIGRNWSEV